MGDRVVLAELDEGDAVDILLELKVLVLLFLLKRRGLKVPLEGVNRTQNGGKGILMSI